MTEGGEAVSSFPLVACLLEAVAAGVLLAFGLAVVSVKCLGCDAAT